MYQIQSVLLKNTPSWHSGYEMKVENKGNLWRQVY